MQTSAFSLIYFKLFLQLGEERRYLGLVNHVSILDNTKNPSGFPHLVRFWDGEHYRFLEGTVLQEKDSKNFDLDMGEGKKYLFRYYTGEEEHRSRKA